LIPTYGCIYSHLSCNDIISAQTERPDVYKMKTCVQHVSAFADCSHPGPTITSHESPCPYSANTSAASHRLAIPLNVSDKDHDVLEALRLALNSNTDFAWINGCKLKDHERNEIFVVVEKQELVGLCFQCQMQQLKAG
jgi:hypothetical protein